MKRSFKSVALIGKYRSPDVAEPLLELARYLSRRHVRVIIDELTASEIRTGSHPVLPLPEIGEAADLVIVIGGDGTMLNIARAIAPHGVPLVGVNQGRLGFLTDISTSTMLKTMGTILEGRYVTEDRMLLDGRVYRGGDRVADALAFNDVVVSKGTRGGMIELEFRIEGEFIHRQRSDGLIVATPTGSTAYALSSGGPIVHPSLTVMTVVPVSPHTLSNRPIVIGGASKVEIVVMDAADPRVHFDSHTHVELHAGDRVQVRRYARALRLLHPAGHSYYRMLREKLNWNRE
ncbi:MAG: NAD kinase [Burkholderiales bacterium]|nr:NAD kinase [Burkholderiales bacterium]